MFSRIMALFTTNSLVGNLGVSTVLSLLVWFIAPHISIDGVHPFRTAGVRVFIMALIYVFTFIKMAVMFVIAHKGQSLEKIKSIWQSYKAFSRRVFKASKAKTQDGYDYLYNIFTKNDGARNFPKLPLYLIVGTKGCGKTKMLENAGHRFLEASYYGKKAEQLVMQFSDLDWYFTDQAIYVDCANVFHTDNKNLIRLIKQLRKRRKSKPLSGIIMLFALPDLILSKHETRRNVMKDYSDQVILMHKILKTVIPVYTLFTKVDLVNGFAEYFNHLSKEDLMQVWGVTFPLEISSKPKALQQYFEKDYEQIIQRLTDQLITILDIEKSVDKRQVMFDFPQQMKLFHLPLVSFIQELYAAIPKQDMMQFRGMYFTSAEQSGDTYDFIAHAIGSKFNLNTETQLPSFVHQESYFLFNIFQKLILSESDYVGFSIKMNRIKKWFARVLWVGVPTLVLGTAWSFHRLYIIDQNNNIAIANSIDTYKHANHSLSIQDPSLAATLPSLTALRDIENLLAQQPRLFDLFVSNHMMKYKSHQTLNKVLEVQYLPRVAANLETILNSPNLDTNTLYATLKGYLSFSPEDDTTPDSMLAPMELKWSKQYADNPDTKKSLYYYLNRASQLQVNALPLDRPLINKVRLELQQVVPSDRAYALLTIKSMASNLPDVVINTLAGNLFSHVFTVNAQSATIPALYTAEGYQKLFVNNHQTIADQVSKDNHDIGLDANSSRSQSLQSIQADMAIMYNKNYHHYWQQMLQNTHVVSINNLQQAQTVLAALTSSQSPFNQLVSIIDSNTNPVASNHVTVSQSYQAIHQFASSGLSGSALKQVNADFDGMQKIVANIMNNPNPQQAALAYIQSFPNQKESDPFKSIAALANKAPWPLNQWINGIAQQTWQVIAVESLQQINQSWLQNVVPFYQAHIQQHYPIQISADRSLSMDNFAAFFGVNGLVNQFYHKNFNQYLDQNGSWKVKVYNGYALPLSPSTVAFFEKSHQIATDYFNSAGKPSVSFTLTPASLASEAASMQLMMGDKSLSYAHGPQVPTLLTWPLSLDEDQMSLQVTNFRQQHYGVSADGPWALFKIFKHAHVIKNNQGYLLQYRLGRLSFAINCETDAPIRALTLADFHALVFPYQLNQKGKS